MNSQADTSDELAKQILETSPNFKYSFTDKMFAEVRYLIWRIYRKWFFRKTKFESSKYLVTKFQDNKSVDIVIPVFGRSNHIASCLESIENSDGIEPSVIIIDNGVDEETKKAINSFGCVTSYIKNEENVGFGGACDQGIKTCEGENIILMNSDIIVRSNAIRVLIEDSQISPHIGLCSSVLINEYGRTEEIGRVLNNQGNAVALFDNCKESKIPEMRLKVVPYSSFACVLLKRSAYMQTNGFDPIFFPAYSEDVDLAIEFLDRRYVSIVSVGSRAFHAQGSSAAELVDLLDIKERNRIALLEKHKEFFSKVSRIDDPYRNPDQLNRARVANMKSSKLLITSSESTLENISAISGIEKSELILHNIGIISIDKNTGNMREKRDFEEEFLDNYGIDIYSPAVSNLKLWLRQRFMVFDEIICEGAETDFPKLALLLIKESQPQANFKYL